MLKAEMCPPTHTQKVCGHRAEWSRSQTAPAGSPKTASPVATDGEHNMGQDGPSV